MGVHGPFIIFGRAFNEIDVHVMGITLAVINGDGAFFVIRIRITHAKRCFRRRRVRRVQVDLH